MKPAKKIRIEQEQAANERIDAEIVQILATEEDLIPSSGFMASVMERVEQESATPAPIRFPWKRAIPGIVLATGVFGWSGVELIRAALSARSSMTITLPNLSAAVMQSVQSAGWIALALGVSLICWLLSRRLAGRGGLL